MVEEKSRGIEKVEGCGLGDGSWDLNLLFKNKIEGMVEG